MSYKQSFINGVPATAFDSVGTPIAPEYWGITVTSSTADGPTLLTTTDGVGSAGTWTQTITYDSNGWPSTGAWVKS